MEACELTTRSLTGEASTSLAYRFKARSLRAARDSKSCFARYEEQVFGSRPSVKHIHVDDCDFSTCTVRVPLPPSFRKAAPLPPPPLSLSLSRRYCLSCDSRCYGRRLNACASQHRRSHCRDNRHLPPHSADSLLTPIAGWPSLLVRSRSHRASRPFLPSMLPRRAHNIRG